MRRAVTGRAAAAVAALAVSVGCAAGSPHAVSPDVTPVEPPTSALPTPAPSPTTPSATSAASVTGVPGLPAAAARTPLDVPGGAAFVLEPRRPTGRVVIYLHGAGGSAEDLVKSGARGREIEGLLDAGYAVAAANAYGTVWANARSDAAYRALYDVVAPRYGTHGVFALGMSMGGLASWHLVRDRHVAAWGLIFPVCSLQSILDVGGHNAHTLRATYGVDIDRAVRANSPPTAPAGVAGLAVVVWASPQDTVVPARDNADVCVPELRRAGADVTYLRTVGNHNDPSNFDAGQLLATFARARP